MSFELLGGFAITGLSYIVWQVRLEGKVKYLEQEVEDRTNDIKELRSEVSHINSDIIKQLTSIKESIARIEGALQAKK